MPESILFVDDDVNILAGYKRQLHSQFSIETANSGQQGLEILALQGPFAVVVADYRMPGLDGNQFLVKAKDVSPDTVRMMLTGHAELSQAIEVINQGHIFRFLTKPCALEVLIKALKAGLEQYHLITSERELLEKTLGHSIRLLTEMLSLANPVAFSQMLNIRKIVRKITTNLHLSDSWQYELAAMLSQIGCIALPPNVLEKVHAGEVLTKSEESVYASHPIIGYKLLVDIPRLGSIPIMVRDQLKMYADYQNGKPALGESNAELGAQIIKVAVDYDRFIHGGKSHLEVVQKMAEYTRIYHPDITKALGVDIIIQCEFKVRIIKAEDVEAGMIANEDIFSKNGELVVMKDQEISYLSLQRLTFMAKECGVIEPFRVLVPIK
jgi:response regulator RpfG family c-di-GMP phosphodiesterase